MINQEGHEIKAWIENGRLQVHIDLKEKGWVTTQDGNHLFLDGQGTLRISPDGPSVYGDDEGSKEEDLLGDGKFVDTEKLFGNKRQDLPDSVTQEQLEKLENRRTGQATVSLRDLIPTQDDIGADKVRGLAEKFDPKKADLFVVEEDGKFFIYDGHHTAAAAILAGFTELKAFSIEAGYEEEDWDDEDYD
jgi:hypothetical protein